MRRFYYSPFLFIIISCLVFIFSMKAGYSAEITNTDLISNCGELIAIYNKRGEKRFLAGLSTSVAESMRAGICRGMLEEHAYHDRRCRLSWYDQALSIASTSPEDVKGSSVEELLGEACR